MQSSKLPSIKTVMASGVIIFVAICVAYFLLDRPLVTFAAEHGLRQFRWLHHIQTLPEYFIITQPLMILFSVAVMLRARFVKQTLSDGLDRFCFFIWASTISILLSVTAKPPLKFIFSRTWPDTFKEDNMSFLQDGVYGFHWFEVGVAYKAFPSGHTMAVTAMAMVIWYIYPKLRWLSITAILAVVIGLLGMYYHFLSDTLAGFYVGWICAVLGIYFARILGAKIVKGNGWI